MTKAIMSPGREKSAARQLAERFSAETLDSLIKDAVKSGTAIEGADGLLNELTKAVLERALQTEMTHHLGYESGDPAGRGSGNSRNGSTSKTVTTVNSPVTIDVPRDRNDSFEPVIVPKKTRRLGNINSVVLSLYSRGMTTRDIEAHLAEVYGATVSRELISNVTEVVDEIKAWQSRPLDEGYPILYIDGRRLRIRDNGVAGTKVAYLAIGVDVEGRKHAPAAGSKTASYRHRSRMHDSPNAVLRIVHIIPSVAVVHRHRTGPDAAVHNTWRLPREQRVVAASRALRQPLRKPTHQLLAALNFRVNRALMQSPGNRSASP